MLQPPQLQQVSAHYASQIAELRDFLAQTGLPLDTPETLPHLTTLLRDDRTFHRDLTSHVWVVLDSFDGHTNVSDLLGILALAAAGQRFAVAADEAAAHSLLRFLMEARRSFDATSATPIRPATSTPAPPRLAPITPFPSTTANRQESPTYLSRTNDDDEDDDEELFAVARAEDSTDGRKRIAAIVAACLLLALFLGLWLHHHSAASTSAAALATSATETPTTTTTITPPVSPAPTAPAPQPAAPAHHAIARHLARVAPAARRPTRERDHSSPHPIIVTDDTSPASEPSTPAPNALSHTDTAENTPPPSTYRRPAPPARPAASISAPRTGISQPPATAHHYNVTATPREGFVRSTSLGTMAANVLYSPAPAYPAEASSEHVQGEVRLEAEIDRDGNVISTRVISGPPLLREAAANAVDRWHYRPYLSNGRPIGMNTEIVMNFQLPGIATP